MSKTSKPKEEIKEFPQQSIDLMAWQYAQGVADTLIKLGSISVGLANEMIKAKMARISEYYNGRKPTYNLVATMSARGFEITKVPW